MMLLRRHLPTGLGLAALVAVWPLWSVRAGDTAAANDPATVPANGLANASAQTGSGPPDDAGAERVEPFLDVPHNRRLTGDWGGARRRLEQLGVEWNLTLSVLYQHNARGGLDTHHAHRINGRADMELSLSTGPMGLWPGGQFYVFTESGWNDSISDKVGDLMGVDALSIYDEPIRVRELWYEQRFLEEKIRFKFGKYDMAVDIDTNAFANWEVEQFLHSALVNMANIPFPDYGVGAVLGIHPAEWVYFTAALADAEADGRETGLNTAFHGKDDFFSAFELGFLPVWKTPWGDLAGGYRFIMWYDPRAKARFFNDLRGRRRTIPWKRDDVGFGFNMDQMLWKERSEDAADEQGLGFFLRYGWANEDANEIEHFWSLGVQYLGPVPCRDADVLAFGFAQSIISDQMHTYVGGDRESVYEAYYRIEVFPWMHVTPDFQWVVNPGAQGGRDAFVAGVRIEMMF